ncbi:hypothetical protein NBRC111894_3887 [Sporolactobacillus inulinus]|uniref:Uncharacterized protein n=1 Tax=Sporolactobacillus inulinus TaxID=2078 RepID=A0A4Y1ZHA6_9BACL|nr:hypothetical protein NBRC111894_3887 [Sporolactobacillus inulinus]
MRTMARRLQKELALGLIDAPATLERDLKELKRLHPPT